MQLRHAGGGQRRELPSAINPVGIEIGGGLRPGDVRGFYFGVLPTPNSITYQPVVGCSPGAARVIAGRPRSARAGSCARGAGEPCGCGSSARAAGASCIRDRGSRSSPTGRRRGGSCGRCATGTGAASSPPHLRRAAAGRWRRRARGAAGQRALLGAPVGAAWASSAPSSCSCSHPWRCSWPTASLPPARAARRGACRFRARRSSSSRGARPPSTTRRPATSRRAPARQSSTTPTSEIPPDLEVTIRPRGTRTSSCSTRPRSARSSRTTRARARCSPRWRSRRTARTYRADRAASGTLGEDALTEFLPVGRSALGACALGGLVALGFALRDRRQKTTTVVPNEANS